MSNVLFFESQNQQEVTCSLMLRKDVSLNAFLLEERSYIISETEQIWAQSVLEWKMCNKNSSYYEKGRPCLGRFGGCG